MAGTDKLTALQDWIKKESYDALLVPMADRFQSEYVPEHDRRLSWLTGFTGSAGSAIITQEKAIFFTDGRYTLQAENEVDKRFQRFNSGDMSPTKWLKENLPEAKLAYDPWLYTEAQLDHFRQFTLVPVKNPIDELWKDRPEPNSKPAFIHPENLAGKTTNEKLKPLLELMEKEDIGAWLLTSPEIINWLLNIRGYDLPNTPVTLSYAVVQKRGKIHLFMDMAKAVEIKHAEIHALNEIETFLNDYENIAYDPAEVPVALAIKNAHKQKNPLLLAKASKNEAEREGVRAAHKRDGASLTSFFHWLTTNGVQDGLDEVSLSEKLYEFRAKGNMFHSESFPTIAGFRDHGAIIHYRATDESKYEIKGDGLLLVDSGAQYLDGTTDVTRTISLGKPTEEECEAYTRVLQGHINLANAIFPKGTTGHALDAIARFALWQGGLDYDHGTGHGVGYFLNVHEGPQNISKRFVDVPLQPGMVVSNEPGYYKNGAFGIRIENLVMVRELPDKSKDGRAFYGFETLTLSPYDRKLIKAELLSMQERTWINEYHARVYKTLAPQMEKNAAEWLKEQTLPV